MGLRFACLFVLLVTCSALPQPARRTLSAYHYQVYIPGHKCGRCPKGMVCAGTSFRKRCVVPMAEDKLCGLNPYWVCAKGLKCYHHICRRRKVRIGGDCTPRGARCVRRAICAGTIAEKRCVAPLGVGKRCARNPYSVCRLDLRCINGFCRTRKVAKGGDCNPDLSVCEGGTVCAGPGRRMKCVRPKREGRSCGRNSFQVCESGLKCDGGVCVKPKIGLGADCKPKGSVCQDGLICRGGDSLRKCVKGMGENQKCGLNLFWVCKTGLTCVRNICIRKH